MILEEYTKQSEPEAYNLQMVISEAKWLILGIFMLCLVVSVVYTQIREPVYTSEAVFRFGEINDASVGRQVAEGNTEAGATLADLLDKYGHRTQKLPYISAQLDKMELRVKAYGPNPEETQKFLAEIMYEIEFENTKKYNSMMSKQNEMLVSLKKQRQTVVDMLNMQEPKVRGERNGDIYLPLLMRLQYDLEQSIYLTEFNTARPPLVVQQPTLPQAPRGAGMTFFFVLSILGGFTGGILIVLTRNYLNNRISGKTSD